MTKRIIIIAIVLIIAETHTKKSELIRSIVMLYSIKINNGAAVIAGEYITIHLFPE